MPGLASPGIFLAKDRNLECLLADLLPRRVTGWWYNRFLARPTPHLAAQVPPRAAGTARHCRSAGLLLSLPPTAQRHMGLRRLRMGMDRRQSFLCSIGISDYIDSARDPGADRTTSATSMRVGHCASGPSMDWRSRPAICWLGAFTARMLSRSKPLPGWLTSFLYKISFIEPFPETSGRPGRWLSRSNTISRGRRRCVCLPGPGRWPRCSLPRWRLRLQCGPQTSPGSHRYTRSLTSMELPWAVCSRFGLRTLRSRAVRGC